MFGDFGKMMKVAADMKRRMPEMQAKLEQSQYSGEAGGGVVKAVVNGKLRFLELKIDKALLADGKIDTEMLEDLVKAAVSSAQSQAAEAAAAAMQEITGGMNIPGMDGLL
jgi:DNA-binding YbaB/EbfC family protein